MKRTKIAAAVLTLGLAVPGAVAVTPAGADSSTLPCWSQIKALSRAEKQVKKAKTAHAKATAKKKVTRARAALKTCQATPKVIVDETTIAADDMLTVRVDAPEPKAGTHYRVAFYGVVPDDVAADCAFVVKKDWANPKGIAFLSAVLDGGSPVLCTGPGEVVLQTVPDSAPESYTGTSVARQKVTITPAADVPAAAF